MGILHRLRGLLSGSSTANQDEGLYFYVRLDKTGEIVRLRIAPSQELNPDYGRGGFVSRKQILGPRTFARAEATFRFDEAHRLMEWDIVGGSLTTHEAWEEQQAVADQQAG